LLLFAANFLQWTVTPQSGLYYYYYYPCVMILGVAIAVALRSLPARVFGTRISLLFLICAAWGFRTMPISVPERADHPFRDDGDHDSGMMPITRSGLMAIS
jgi:hypothetical protein